MQRIWIVLRAYYTHGEAATKIFFNDHDLAAYLKTFIDESNDSEYGLSEDDDDVDPFLDLVYTSVLIGRRRIREQIGWGILEIKCINLLDNNHIRTYNSDIKF